MRGIYQQKAGKEDLDLWIKTCWLFATPSYSNLKPTRLERFLEYTEKTEGTVKTVNTTINLCSSTGASLYQSIISHKYRDLIFKTSLSNLISPIYKTKKEGRASLSPA